MSRTNRNLPSKYYGRYRYFRKIKNIGQRRVLTSRVEGYTRSNRERSVVSRTSDNWDDKHVAAFDEVHNSKI